MRQAWVTRHGGPEVFAVREQPDAPPAAGEVAIRVRAIGVNFAEVLARIGLYPDAPPPPCVLGYEAAGEVAGAGPGVTAFAPGERVLAIANFGAYGDRLVVPADHVMALPADISYERAAALPVNYLTAWLLLVRMGNLRAGETVLVHAAAGGVGLAALQICRSLGATVIGSASPAKHDRLRAAGVAHCLDSGRAEFAAEVKRLTGGRGADMVLDAIGGRSYRESYRCLGSLGRLMVFGMSSFAPSSRRRLLSVVRGVLTTPRFHPLSLINRNRGVFGLNLGHLWQHAELLLGVLREIVAGVAAGRYDPVIDRTFPLDQAGAAHTHLQERRNFGKVLLIP